MVRLRARDGGFHPVDIKAMIIAAIGPPFEIAVAGGLAFISPASFAKSHAAADGFHRAMIGP